MDSNTQSSMSSEDLKNLGNASFKDGNLEKAVLLYTQAIKLEPSNHMLYSNRSFAFLKLNQYYLALQDAKETIRLQPNWPKGYFRKAQVEEACKLFDEAIISYSQALALTPNDTNILQAITKTTVSRRKKIIKSQNIIWLSTVIGLIFGIAIVISDYTLTSKPTLSHPIAMVAFAVVVSGSGWGIGKVITSMQLWSETKYLQPAEELENSASISEESSTSSSDRKPKYTKAQARQRFKQGKML